MERSDAEAVKLAARGDADAFMVLVQRYRAPLIAYVHGRTRLRDEAEDVAQEAFCRAWAQLPRLREPAAFGHWLFAIAGNLIVTAARRTRPGPLEVEPIELRQEPSPDRSLEVHAAVGRLHESQRLVVSLRHFSGLSTVEIARVLDQPEGTVRSRLSRAYDRLRECLADRVEV